MGNFVIFISVGEVKDILDGYLVVFGVCLFWNLVVELVYFDFGDYKYISKDVNFNINIFDNGK